MIRAAFFIGIVAEMLSFYIAVYRKELRRNFHRREWSFFLLAGCCALLIGCLPLNGILPAEMAGYAAGFFLVAGLFERSLAETLKYYSIAFLGVSMLNTMMISAAWQWSHQDTDEMQMVGVVAALAIMWIYFGLWGKRYEQSCFSADWKIGGLILAIMVTELALISFSLFILPMTGNGRAQNTGVFLIDLGGGVIFILCFAMLYQVNVVKDAKIRYQFMEEYNEQQKNYFHLMLEKEKETQKMRHDYQAELALLGNYLRNGEYEKLEQYLGEMVEASDRVRKTGYDVGNETVNVILNHYLSKNLLWRPQIRISGRISDEIAISQRDLCIIVSNLLRNAIEELEENSQKDEWMEFRVSQSERELCIQTANSCTAGVGQNAFQKKAVMRKKKGIHYGLGLQNIGDAVARNQGRFAWKMEGGVFEAKIVIPLDQNKK